MRLNKYLGCVLLYAVAILVGSCWSPLAVQAAGVNPLLQGLSDNPRVTGMGQVNDEVQFEAGQAVCIEEQGNGRARIVCFMGYIPPGGFAYDVNKQMESGHLIINGYDCQQFGNRLHPLWYKQFDVDLNKRQWRVLVMHKIDPKNWGINRLDCVPEDKSYVPMDDYIWTTIMKLVPPDVIEDLRDDL